MLKNISKRSFLFLPAFLMMLLSSTVNAFADSYVTLDRVNLRTSPSMDAEIVLTVDTGASVNVESLDGDWYKVVYNDKQGYMKSEFVGKQEAPEIIEAPEQPEPEPVMQPELVEQSEPKPVMQPEPAEQPEPEPAVQPELVEQPESKPVVPPELEEKYVTLDRVNLRAEPSLDASVLSTVNTGSSIKVGDLDDGWYRVVYNDIQGYIKSEFVGKQDELKQPGGVELVAWPEAKGVFTIGVSAEIYDVRSGLRYYVKSFSNGNHADVEPVTKEDTNTMLKTFNGKWSWDTRPILVTINGRTMAASISGMPHGGGINSNNGMDGQVCIHFKDSRTHNGNRSHEQDHQTAVLEAYNKSK